MSYGNSSQQIMKQFADMLEQVRNTRNIPLLQDQVNRIDAAVTSVQGMQSQVNRIDSTVSSVQVQVNSVADSVSAMQSQVSRIDSSVASLIGTGTAPDTTAPTPTVVSSSNVTENAVTLSWTASTDNVGVTGYDVYQGVTKLATVTGTQYTVTGLSASTEYTFQVLAKDAAGNISTSSNIVTITTSDPVVSPTPDPSALTVTLTESSEAFRSPMMGFRPWHNFADTTFDDHEYGAVYRHIIGYRDLEVNATDTVQKIKDWCNTYWATIPAKNIKVSPIVVMWWPGAADYFPNGISHTTNVEAWQPDNTNTINRIVAMIAKLGEAWDNDPRVAFIQLGLYGKWGEHHVSPDKLSDGQDHIPLSFQTAMGNAAVAAFKNKKVTIRYPHNTFTAFDFGCYWDSFALPNDASSGNGIISKNNWRTQFNVGEVAYNWGDQSNLGGSPDANLSIASNVNYTIDWIMRTHTSSLTWISQYTASNTAVAAGAKAMQKVLGYRFVLSEVTFTSNVTSGGTMNVSFKVTNKGSSPFYYDWPVEACLLNSGGTVAWRGIFQTDIRQWLPGDSWNSTTDQYSVPPAVHTVSGDFTIPGTVTNGTYTLALTILDPFGWTPSVRFANTNYYTGGRTPVGKVGIGGTPANQTLNAFALLKSDNTLGYSLTASTYPGSIADGGTAPGADTTPPTVSALPAAGTYTSTQSVVLSANESATIYYTLDGTAPTTASAVYSAPISVGATTTLRYFGRDTAGNESTVQSAVYTINAPALFSDDFNRTASNTTLGVAWTPVGTNPWGTTGTEAYNVNDVDGSIITASTSGATNYSVTHVAKGCIATGVDSRRFNLIARFIDSQNFIYVSMVGGSMTLYKYDGGTGSALGSYVSQTTTNDVYYTIKAECNGGNIKVYVNDVLKIDYTMTAAEITKFSGSARVGWRYNKSGTPTTNARVDNILVSPL
ncbi:chitobiase/beta-hexosaminidase C-terminal domain-containing protein [Paenibacillus silvisoli]|uniref:chitobiase/beta-hexosaminidase C-terminal domain-containing protein n=1 Tax=Paenibacillus silvisoli TaxID=3110539 RepID=UPI0028047AF2|nr:chitobiase/beta-hexosaminidase C-terminal domain-containing protein [Paenibacillus silvisoli]